ncbi:hypothetical protein G6O67_007743 [Ophiocordyceps sinensis]|uniref:Spt20-like SEP domain-containing protein n=1 Tax=Ophiocordyceps sinensis TaxID=72228 RepID=A0A8H4LUG0_9HYPO|nr:hypothetical protein G6O67_007743 [Ophiocordyceps sinensis]
MAPSSPVVVQQNGVTKAKRPVPPGIQTNGAMPSTSSPSPSMSAKKPPLSAKHTPTSAGDRTITASTVRPVNRARREASSQAQGRHSRNSAGIRAASFPADMPAQFSEPLPYVVPDSYILKKYVGRPPSLVVHLHPAHFRFDGQDGMFPYKSPMRVFLKHLRARTIPHDLLEQFNQGGVPFYDGRLIVQVHDHKSPVQTKDVAKSSPASTSTVLPSSVHNYNQCLTPSPYIPFPKEDHSAVDGTPKKEPHAKAKEESHRDRGNVPMLGPAEAGSKSKAALRPKIFTVVLHPTQESLQADLRIKAATPRGSGDGRFDAATAAQPSTPMSLVPPTPTASNMPPPAKRPRKEKMELDASNIHAAEGQILLATAPPLMLKPTRNAEETIALLEAMAHPMHSEPPPLPMTRKRTIAEMAADEAAAAGQERYMLVLDDRLYSKAAGTQGSGGADGDVQTGAATFEPRFERFKVIEDIKREQAEKKEQERIKQQENDRRMQLQKQQEMIQRQQAEAEKARREAAAVRENQLRQAEQRQNMAARAAQNNAAAQNNGGQNAGQPQHSHPIQNGVMSGGPLNNVGGAGQNAMANVMQGQALPRFQAQLSQPPAASPVIRQATPQQPQNMSSPMVASVPMQQTNSSMAASPPRPPSVVQTAQMSVPMAHNMSARGSQQSHPSNTPRMHHSTPNMAHGTPINRPAMIATPRMGQASPPPNMVAQNSQMGQAMMMNNQGMNPHNNHVFAQMAAQQRAIAQQQHQQQQQQQQQQMAAMQNGGANPTMNGQGMSPHQQQQMMQMMQRQMLLQQQQQQQQHHPQQQQQPQQGMLTPGQQQQFAQYAQQLQTMQGTQLRQMNPAMSALFQQGGGRAGQMGNPMQRQVSGQMMNGGNANMQAIAAMQMQQQHQQHQHQQHQQQQHQQQQHQQQQQQHHPQQQHHQQQQHQPHPQQQHQQPGQPPQMGGNPIQVQIQSNARQIYARLMQGAAAKFGGPDRVPQEAVEKMKQTSLAQAQQLLQQNMAQRRAQQQIMLQQQQVQQQQQQQAAAMQGMGGMMGHQGM